MAINLDNITIDRIGWKDDPDTSTPLDSGNLKEMENNSEAGINILKSNVQIALTELETKTNKLNTEINNLNTEIDNLKKYSTEEVKTGETWIDGKPIYRKVITGTLTNAGINVIADLSSLNFKTIIKIDLISNNTDPISSQYYESATDKLRCHIMPSNKSLRISVGSSYPTLPLDYIITLEYTKTTD